MSAPLLPLRNLSDRHWGLDPATATCWLEAARVCLDRHHSSPQDFEIIDDADTSLAEVEWDAADERMRDNWNNKDDATRDGAYVCALAATELIRGLLAVKRAETRTGADYYVAPKGTAIQDLEECLRLEVSGTDGDSYEVRRRLKGKLDQAGAGDSNLPALATVVGFRVKLIMIKTVDLSAP
jgi:hypothetical protein